MASIKAQMLLCRAEERSGQVTILAPHADPSYSQRKNNFFFFSRKQHEQIAVSYHSFKTG